MSPIRVMRGLRHPHYLVNFQGWMKAYRSLGADTITLVTNVPVNAKTGQIEAAFTVPSPFNFAESDCGFGVSPQVGALCWAVNGRRDDVESVVEFHRHPLCRLKRNHP